MDRAGILYYPRFLSYFHIAFEEFFGRALGVPYADVVQRDRVGFPMAHLEVDFRAPLPYGDAALVAVRPTRLGRSSIDWAYEVRSLRRGDVCAAAKAVTVTVDLDSFKPVDTPQPYRGMLEARLA